MKSVRSIVVLGLLVMLLLPVIAVQSQDEVLYTSQPDEVAVFLNNIAYARDTITLPGGTDVQVVLPPQIYPDTLILREDGARVSVYRIGYQGERPILQWESASSEDSVREVTLEYLLNGLSWTPKYEMWLAGENVTEVRFDFFAQLQNSAFDLNAVDVRLIAGRVDTSQQLGEVSTVTANQYAAGYEPSVETPRLMGAATIQHVYDIESIDAIPGDTVFVNLTQNTLVARRVLLWNASTDQQVTVIYKVSNDSNLPFAEGIVRTYQNDLFAGSDFIEVTPIGSEGSVTIGRLQNVRVNRTETRTAVDSVFERDTQHDIELSLSNFGDEDITIEVVDRYGPDALDFGFSAEPERQGDNLFRWEVTLAPGETQTITYTYFD